MLSEEEIEDIKDSLRLLHKILWNEHREGTYTIQRTLEYINQLETNNKKLIEKLEDLINNKFRAFFEGDTEFPDDATEMEIVKYIKATDLEEILEITKGEKE